MLSNRFNDVMQNKSRKLLKITQGMCPECRRLCVAEIWRVGGERGQVLIERECPEHGKSSNVLSSDARLYWLSKGDSERASCCGGGGCDGSLGANATLPDADIGRFDKLSTCLALIEIVDSCNLSCPVCFADSPRAQAVDAVSFADFRSRVEGVIAAKGKIEILQLSGGEPTIHPQFFDLLGWAMAHEKIDYVLLNTNGVKFAKDAVFLEKMAAIFAPKKLQLYLQFDGTGAEGQAELRGGDLRAMRDTAISNCAGIGLPITLAMTVVPQNISQLWDTICFGMAHSNVRGVSFQPFFGSGRSPSELLGSVPDRLNAADIVLAIIEQSADKLGFGDFTPLPCGDPNCAIIGYLLKAMNEWQPISKFVDFSQMQGFLKNKVNYNLADLAQCGCDNQALGDLLKNYELREDETFRLFVDRKSVV